MALINAKNGMMAVAAAFAVGQGIAAGINTLRARAQSKGLADEFTPELNRLQVQLEDSQSALTTLQGQLQTMDVNLTAMDKSLQAANRTKIRWSIASFCLGLIPFTLKMLGYL
jgi:hypothetical protein